MHGNLKIHFVGIGGIGVSALARYYLYQGWSVSGSDIKASEITRELKSLGAKIHIGPRSLKKLLPDLLVYSPAVRKDDPEIDEAKALGIKAISYPEALGQLSKTHKTIAVAGAHGKSTTTAMIGLMMIKAKLDPTIIVGTKVREFGNSNFRAGKSEYLVIEACEYDKSFLNYWPEVIVMTNIEMDHMECYANEAELIQAFAEFAAHLPRQGALMACIDDANVAKFVLHAKKTGPVIKKYSLTQPEAKPLRRILRVPGEHNVANALAALAVGRWLKISDKKIFKSLAEYSGAWRRFECQRGIIGGKKITVVSDYGHHPTQIKLTMEAARAGWPGRKIICVFQPHQAWRTHLLFDRFVDVLRGAPADKIFITDIYQVAGRESAAISKKVSSQKLVGQIRKESVEYAAKNEIFAKLKKEVKGGEIVLVMGAGDIYDLSKKLAPKK